jgi:signal transduction histidine kinase
MVSGILSLGIIAAALVMLSAFLVREILELRRQDSFIDSVTHELKSPLASLRLCLETLARPDLEAAQRHELQTMMFDDVERLGVFIDDVLESSRVPFKRRVHSLNEIDLQASVNRCVHIVCARYKLDPSVVKIAVPRNLRLLSDSTAFETILKNLLDNAIKYSHVPPQIEVVVTGTERKVHMAVRDNGIGVPQKDLKRIFDRFYRVSSEAVRERSGTGLGLFVVQSLVRNLGGKVFALSEGSGLTVVVKLPRESQTKGNTNGG